MEYVLAYDLGTGAVKAVLVTQSGAVAGWYVAVNNLNTIKSVFFLGSLTVQ